MSTSARRSFGPVFLAAFLIAAGSGTASAQQFDPNALDTSGAVSLSPKAKKTKAQQSQPGGAAQQRGGGDRQFGELEGWSPGKAPPGKEGKEKEGGQANAPNGKMPIGMSPSGNMSVGLPF
ncbi:MAG: hypothetical protein FJX45_06650 [Alphaproteobacteria bacterium]|nr:hypothetical protein [Alphaproteobacteria bacterium]MBM3651744.1 hypothetical protein [Alphaproteobacteria bacterium]